MSTEIPNFPFILVMRLFSQEFHQLESVLWECLCSEIGDAVVKTPFIFGLLLAWRLSSPDISLRHAFLL